MIRNVCLLLIIFTTSFVSGQNLQYQKYRTIGLKIQTNGWGLNYSLYNPKFKYIDAISFGYQNYKTLGESKRNNETIANSPIVLNKMNNMYLFQAGVNKKITLGVRNDQSNIGVNALLGGGPALGIFKPIFIEYSQNDTQVIGLQRVRYNPAVHNPGQIFKALPLQDRLSESKLKLGIWTKAALRFDWGSYQSNFKAIEIGVNLHFIPNSEVIIYQTAPRQFYGSMYLMLNFGALKD